MNGERQPSGRHEEVYVRIEAACKEQPAICLRHMEEKFGGLTVRKKGHAHTQHGVLTNHLADMDGLNVRRHQQRPRYARRKTNLSLKVNLSILMRGIECVRNFQRHKLMLYHEMQASSSTPKNKR
jgi:hypothetical protein